MQIVNKLYGYGRPVGKTIIVLLSAFFIVHSARFFSLSPDVLGKYLPYTWAILGHIAGGAVALVAGPFLFWKSLRQKYRRTHRIIGQAYTIGVLFAAFGALILVSTTALSLGLSYIVSLHALGATWTITTVLAWRMAVTKQFKLHEEWATRSYIVTMAFVIQSVVYMLPITQQLGAANAIGEVLATIIWVSWTGPMFLYDMILSFQKRSRQPAPAL
ncbi:DUF2306 domain-containing protein [Fulvivirgaceae bacterium PWU5]|uniref:DUF2306 domain-containing protein n=1 Tax=Dawidia cretensis TaxID=2782350 RepID=A0AAP2DTR9_9BACT|nr:DUF2306 domain-containing protein [Dawidia cretensis]MBT1707303.1 DUF2306 domain-containing protein [Dawidia cretensis]